MIFLQAFFRCSLIFILGGYVFSALPLQAEENNSAELGRIISADWNKVKGPRSEVYDECVGAGRAFEGLRGEWQQQLKLCKQEIGFKYIRVHGLLCDEMAVY